MGLDIYLYHYNDRAETDRLEAEYEAHSSKLWGEAGNYNSLTEPEKDAINEKLQAKALELGLDKWGGDEKNKAKIEEDSRLYPEHYFKVGYFRSSYNSGGINSILRNLSLPDLQGIFSYPDEYQFQPNWEDVREKANAVLQALRERIEKGTDVRCFDVSSLGLPKEPATPEEAIKVFLQEKEGRSSFDAYSNSHGHFYMSGLNVLALIPGTGRFGGRPTTYVIHREDTTWYMQALEIVIETCEYVITHPERSKIWVHWSS